MAKYPSVIDEYPAEVGLEPYCTAPADWSRFPSLHLHIKPSSMCFFARGGKLENQEGTHTNSKQIGPSFPHRDLIQDLTAVGRREDVGIYRSLTNEMRFTCQKPRL